MLRQQRRRMDAPTLARIRWCVKKTGAVGQGEPIPIGIAHANVKALNAAHPEMYHLVEEVA